MPYFDYAATTPLDPRIAPLLQELSSQPLNPSSLHQSGQKARRLLEAARASIAQHIGLHDPTQIIFTSSATESANLALRGLCSGNGEPVKIASSTNEHSCISETLESLEKEGLIELEIWPVNEEGKMQFPQQPVPQLKAFCMMHVNNETGVLQPVEQAKAFREKSSALWVCDASQSLGKIPIELNQLGADLLLLSGHKIYGPAGIACLAGPAVAKLRPLIIGGPQEDNRRAGTPSVALAVCFAKALELAVEEQQLRREKLLQLEKYFFEALHETGLQYNLNGSQKDRVAGFFNISLPNREGIDLVIALDQRGVHVSPGAACSTGVVAVSPVLKGMFPADVSRAAGGVRITLSHLTTTDEVARLVKELASICQKRK